MAGQMIDSPYRFAVPVLLSKDLGIELPNVVSCGRVSATAEGFGIIADVFTFADEADCTVASDLLLQRAREHGREFVPGGCLIDNAPCRLFFAKEPAADLRCLDEKPDPALMLQRQLLLEADMRQLSIFSRFVDCRIVFCHSDNTTEAPFSEKPGVVYLFSHGRPPGLFDCKLYVKELFGLSVWKEREIRIVNRPTRGRGRLIEQSGLPVFQVLGSNYYQLCLTSSDAHNPSNREIIFRKLLGLLYVDLVARDSVRIDPLPEITPERFVAFGETCASVFLGDLQEELRETEAEVAQLQGKLAGALVKRQRQLVSIRAVNDSQFLRDLRDRLPHELDKISRVPGVRAVRIVEDGLHIETDSIVLRHGEISRDLGSFVARFDSSGKVSVWSESPRHPKGDHHPHIGKVVLACYGNATIAITKCVSACRYADAVELFMRWLTTYSPETAFSPLEEWPAEWPVVSSVKGGVL